MNNYIQKYETNNINIASAIIASGIPLSNFSVNEDVFNFVFEDSAMCSEIENLWLTDKLQVSAFKYSQAFRQLKNIVFRRQHVA